MCLLWFWVLTMLGVRMEAGITEMNVVHHPRMTGRTQLRTMLWITHMNIRYFRGLINRAGPVHIKEQTESSSSTVTVGLHSSNGYRYGVITMTIDF